MVHFITNIDIKFKDVNSQIREFSANGIINGDLIKNETSDDFYIVLEGKYFFGTYPCIHSAVADLKDLYGKVASSDVEVKVEELRSTLKKHQMVPLKSIFHTLVA